MFLAGDLIEIYESATPVYKYDHGAEDFGVIRPGDVCIVMVDQQEESTQYIKVLTTFGYGEIGRTFMRKIL